MIVNRIIDRLPWSTAVFVQGFQFFWISLFLISVAVGGRSQSAETAQTPHGVFESASEDEKLRIFKNSLIDRHGRPDIIYSNIRRLDTKVLVENEVLRIIRAREPATRSNRLLPLEGGSACSIAAKFFGHKPEMRSALLQVVQDINAWEKARYPDYGKVLMSKSLIIDSVLYGLAENEHPGSLISLDTIGKDGNLVAGSRISLYISLGRRFKSFDAERQDVISILAGFFENETNDHIIEYLNGHPDFKSVRKALSEREVGADRSPANAGPTDGSGQVSSTVIKEKCVSPTTESGSGRMVLWSKLVVMIIAAIILIALIAKRKKQGV
ncbi:MAG: hypothetical protein H7A50_11285 [Akkermansiaceae bacterium]|nr:hypothetical protein [Akkermansiaceae bacterium]